MRALALLPVLALLPLALPAPAPKSPVYIGAKVCGSCHAAAHAKWLTTKHAIAYDTLYNPESWTIARLSGISAKPWESPICLGCHSTAFDTEKWERDDTFRPIDGLQCEGCHGPGSDYAEADIMRDPKRAMAAGLRKPATEYCIGCHNEKNSHTKVLKVTPFDQKAFWSRIAHSRDTTSQQSPSRSALPRSIAPRSPPLANPSTRTLSSWPSALAHANSGSPTKPPELSPFSTQPPAPSSLNSPAEVHRLPSPSRPTAPAPTSPTASTTRSPSSTLQRAAA